MKRLQKYQRSKLEVGKKLPTRPISNPMHSGPGWSGRFFSTSNFDLWYFCSLLTYKDIQYLVWKIWSISVWRMKAKVLLWLLTWFVFTSSTHITEAFVKTEVGCTASYSSANWKLYEYCFMKQKYKFQFGTAQYKNEAKPLITRDINTTHEHYQMRFVTLFHLNVLKRYQLK